jgi:hypothetical protein
MDDLPGMHTQVLPTQAHIARRPSTSFGDKGHRHRDMVGIKAIEGACTLGFPRVALQERHGVVFQLGLKVSTPQKENSA